MIKCTEECWIAGHCPEHSQPMTPRGCSIPLAMSHPCCDLYMDPNINKRHLWSEHDSSRSYVDQDGWASHVDSCKECKNDPWN